MQSNGRLAILTIGNEILDGRIQDTNSSFLANKVHRVGYEVAAITSCPDKPVEICSSLKFLFSKADTVIATGGLGPTEDDRTTEAFAQFFDAPLEHREELEAQMRARYTKRGRPFEKSNLKQALIPKGAEVIPNNTGTAAGFFLSKEDKGRPISAFSLPGVPSELKAMVNETVLPKLESLYPKQARKDEYHIQCFGIPESVAGRKISELNLPRDIELSYRASFPILRLRASSQNCIGQEQKDALRDAIEKQFIFSEEEEGTMTESVHKLLLSTKTTLALAESCTGGMIGSNVTRVPGSSEYFLGGVVSYSNAAKESFLDVQKQTLNQFGAVSHNIAIEMAQGARKRFGTALGLSVTGIAGPGGGSAEKPVGTFFIGLTNSSQALSCKFFFPGSRAGIRRYATYAALDLIRRHLLKLPLGSVAQEVRPADNL